MIYQYKKHQIYYDIHLNIVGYENLLIFVLRCNFIVRIDKYDRLFSYIRKMKLPYKK